MRPVHLSDLDAVVRSILHLSGSARRRKISETIEMASVADRFRKRLGRSHPKYGNGTLSAAASNQVQRSFHCDKTYRDCLGELLRALDGN